MTAGLLNLPLFMEIFGTQIQGLMSITVSLLSSIRAASLPTTNVSSPTKTIAVTRAESLEFKDEFGQWRPACNRFGDEYVAAYNTFAQISAPEEDFEGRLDLYRL